MTKETHHRHRLYLIARGGKLFPTIDHKIAVMAPIGWVDPPFDKTVKTGIRPIRNARNQTMLDRIPMNVIHMAIEIVLIRDPMRPEPSLPYPALPAFYSAW